MPAPLSGPGLGLQLPQNLYPSELFNAPYDFGNNLLMLAPGQALPVPAGTWFVNPGAVSFLQFVDPVTGIWRSYQTGRGQYVPVKSDGFNARVANLTGCPVCAVVTNAGSGYVQNSTTVVPTTGNSTWQALVGGMVSVASVTNAGGGYGVAPLVFLPAPPAGGVQATAFASINAGTVSGVTMTNWGAGYLSTPVGAILPNPTDPNINSGITQAAVTFSLFGSGSISALLCTNPGVPLASAPNLTIAGAGSGATATVLRLSSLQSASIGTGSTGWTNGAMLGAGWTNMPAAVNTNPYIEGFPPAFMPRSPSALITQTGGALNASIATIYDPGLTLTGATATLTAIGALVPTAQPASVALVMGGVNDTIVLQPAP